MRPPVLAGGKRVPFTPKAKFTLGARYDIDLGGSGVVTPSANAVISGSYYSTDYNMLLDLQNAYAPRCRYPRLAMT